MQGAHRAPCGVCRAGLGIASAIEPAGGVSPLRGGAEVCELWSYQQRVVANYRYLLSLLELHIRRGDRFTTEMGTVSPPKGDRFTTSGGDRFTMDNLPRPQHFVDNF